MTAQLSRVLGRGLLTNEGEPWRKQRKLLAPAFRPGQIENYADVMVQRARDFAGEYVDGSQRDVYYDMTRLTLDIVVRTLFGSHVVRAEEVETALDQIIDDFQSLMFTWRTIFPVWFPFPRRRRLEKNRRRFHEILSEIIEQRRPGADRASDLLSRLIVATDDAGKGMSDEQLLDEAVTVFLAGHETTALALTYTLFCLGRHPEARQRVLEEVDSVVGNRPVRFEDIERLKWTRAALDEAMRLYPPAWAIGRQAIKTCEIAGRSVPTGTQLMIPTWVVQRDPAWFDRATEYRPERWFDDATVELHRFCYFPFGGGPRVCIGNHFARLQATLVLTSLLGQVELEVSDDFTLELTPTVTLRPRGPVPMRVRRRDRV
jgi:cytochrome P450